MLSILFPGLGHVYCHRIGRALLFFILPIVYAWGVFLYIVHPLTKLSSSLWMFLVIFFFLEIIISVDAYFCAMRFNADHQVKREINFVARILFCLGIFFVVAFNPLNLIWINAAEYIKENVVEAFMMPAVSMKPALIEGDRVFVDKTIYKNSEPQRGDVIVFKDPEDKDHKKSFIKRVVGLPNETLEIKDKHILINGQLLKEPAQITKISYFNRGHYAQPGQVIQIPADQYFVLGDNSFLSRDGRDWGFIPKKSILGKAYKIYYPFKRCGPVL